MTNEEYKEVYLEFLERRGVETPCGKCDGFGTRTYPDTSTWRRGYGMAGQTLTNDVCDHCWGSGDQNKTWASWRKK